MDGWKATRTRMAQAKGTVPLALTALLATAGAGADTRMDEVSSTLCEIARDRALAVGEGRESVYLTVTVHDECTVGREAAYKVAEKVLERSGMGAKRKWRPGDASIDITVNCMNLKRDHTVYTIRASAELAGKAVNSYGRKIAPSWGGPAIIPSRESRADILYGVRRGAEEMSTTWRQLYDDAKKNRVCAEETTGRAGPTTAERGRNRIRQVQAYLNLLGYSPGTQDGVAGPKTREAVKRFQEDLELTTTGEISDELLALLKVAAAAEGKELP